MKSTEKALRIIRDNEVHSPRRFAELMWPDSAGWKRIHKVGHGATFGGMMPMVGGAFLGKLHKLGLILYGFPKSRIILSNQGDEILNSKKYSTENTRK